MGRVVSAVVLVGSAAGLALVAGPGRASLYSPDDPRFVVPVGEDGKARPLPFGEFLSRLATLMIVRDATKETDDRKAFLERIARTKGKKLSADVTAALAVDLLRVNERSEALNRLSTRLRDRTPNYFVFTTYAAIRADGSSEPADWAEALRYHETALLDSEMPATVKGLTKAQRDWWEKLDRDYVPHYYRLHMKEAEERRDKPQSEKAKMNEAEDVFPLFPIPDRANPRPQPVRFVNDAGVYEPGKLAAAERAKLPPDAIPVVQQLLFWFPGDNRLYWLLAELYAAEGDYAASFGTFHSLSWGRAYSARKVMMDHRQAVEAANKAQPRKASTDDVLLTQPASAEQAPAPPPPGPAPISMRTVMIYFGAVALVGVFAFLRAMSRRAKGDCGPVG